MVNQVETIWLDGKWVKWGDAQLHLLTYSLHYGLAAFEGIRAYERSNGEVTIFRLREHIDRLLDSCRLVFLRPEFSRAQIETACIELLRINRMKAAYLRPIVFLGDGAMGIYAPDNPVRVGIMAWEWGAYLGDEALKKGIRCKISSFARHHVNVGLPKAKITGQYTNSILAKREAKLGGYDEAIMLDPYGYVSEGSGENLFVVKNGTIYTPDKASSILEGITRDTVMQLAREEQIPLVETRLTRDQLWLADEVFLTGTAAEVTPVREIDDRPIGAGVGPITKKLQSLYFEEVKGGESRHPSWLTRVV